MYISNEKKKKPMAVVAKAGLFLSYCELGFFAGTFVSAPDECR